MLDRGTWDMRTGFPGAGAYAAVSNAPSANQICASANGGQAVAGVSGTAFCSTSSELLPSNVGDGDEDNDAVMETAKHFS